MTLYNEDWERENDLRDLTASNQKESCEYPEYKKCGCANQEDLCPWFTACKGFNA